MTNSLYCWKENSLNDITEVYITIYVLILCPSKISVDTLDESHKMHIFGLIIFGGMLGLIGLSPYCYFKHKSVYFVSIVL